MVDKTKLGAAPLLATCRESRWYTPVSHEGDFADPVKLMRAFLRRALHAALKGAIGELLLSRADEIVREASELGCNEYDGWIDLRSEGLPIVLRFLNAERNLVITRRISYARYLAPFNAWFTLEDAVDLKIVVQSHVLNSDGIRSRLSRLPSRVKTIDVPGN